MATKSKVITPKDTSTPPKTVFEQYENNPAIPKLSDNSGNAFRDITRKKNMTLIKADKSCKIEGKKLSQRL